MFIALLSIFNCGRDVKEKIMSVFTDETEKMLDETFPEVWNEDLRNRGRNLEPNQHLEVDYQNLRIRHPNLPEGFDLLVAYDYRVRVCQFDH